MRKITIISILLFVFSVIFVSTASAHVTVNPSEVSAGAFQTFSVSVPTEGSSPTTQLKLMVPQGLKSVTPNVKSGWTISTTTNGGSVSEITWSAGNIPEGQRDDFIFSAQVPGKNMVLKWKAYQTTQDGKVISWDQTPSESEESTPYSQTKVVNDLEGKTTNRTETEPSDSKKASFAIGLSVAALGISCVAFVSALKRKRK